MHLQNGKYRAVEQGSSSAESCSGASARQPEAMFESARRAWCWNLNRDGGEVLWLRHRNLRIKGAFEAPIGFSKTGVREIHQTITSHLRMPKEPVMTVTLFRTGCNYSLWAHSTVLHPSSPFDAPMHRQILPENPSARARFSFPRRQSRRGRGSLRRRCS